MAHEQSPSTNDKPDKMAPIVVGIYAALFFLFGAAIFYMGVKTLLTAKESMNWPSVMGKVVSASMATHRLKKGHLTFHPEVVYQYTVDGQTLSSNELSFGDYGSSDPSHARSVLEKYPEGTEVTVHYSPSNPAKAVLEVGPKGRTNFLLVFGTIWLGACLTMFIVVWALKRQRAANDSVVSTMPIP